MADDSTPRVEKLTGKDNWTTWHYMIRTILECDGLLDVCTGKQIKPDLGEANYAAELEMVQGQPQSHEATGSFSRHGTTTPHRRMRDCAEDLGKTQPNLRRPEDGENSSVVTQIPRDQVANNVDDRHYQNEDGPA